MHDLGDNYATELLMGNKKQKKKVEDPDEKYKTKAHHKYCFNPNGNRYPIH
jgi:hypothetical protein